MSGVKQYARYCASCPCAEQCRTAFGAFWRDKSANGVGCDKPFDGKTLRFVPPPSKREMSQEQQMAWLDEYIRRKEEARTALYDMTPQELDAAVCIKWGGRFKRKYA